MDKTHPLWPICERELLGLPLAAHDELPDALGEVTGTQRPIPFKMGR